MDSSMPQKDQRYLVLSSNDPAPPSLEPEGTSGQEMNIKDALQSLKIVAATPEKQKSSGVHQRVGRPSIGVCDPGVSTPQRKTPDHLRIPVRRKLVFQAEEDESSSDSVSFGQKPKQSSKISGTGSEVKEEKEEKPAPRKKLAQLVVWTNKPGTDVKKKEPVKKEEKKGKEEDNIFAVQYPARPLADQGKGKGKPFRRLNSYNDPIVQKKTPPPPPVGQRRREKRKRGNPGQRRVKDPRLGWPEPGAVVDEQTAAAVAAYQAYLHQFQIHQQAELYALGQGIPQEGEVKQEIAVAGPSSAAVAFTLPEQFTVTETQNEFDLLIQNVVHEEMVNDLGEEEGGEESARKRVRLKAEQREELGDDPGKPRCTYTELIEKALTESGGLTVSEIYNWISEHYPYFKQDDDRWKNSVRHNLSINPYFKKGEKARSGAGHLWTISEESKGLRPSSTVSWDERRRSVDPGDLAMPLDSETDRAVANILGMYRSKMAQEAKKDSSSQPTAEIPVSESCVAPPPSTLTLNEFNPGQFTVDLTGLNIPEGSAINFDELVSHGRLIYVQAPSDPEANKENNQHSSLSGQSILPDAMLSDLTPHMAGLDDPQHRYPASFYPDPALDPYSKGVDPSYDAGSLLTMVPPSDIVAPTTSSDFTLLDQCLHPLDSFESTSGCVTTTTTSALNAALFESKELGIPYTFQIPSHQPTDTVPSDLL